MDEIAVRQYESFVALLSDNPSRRHVGLPAECRQQLTSV